MWMVRLGIAGMIATLGLVLSWMLPVHAGLVTFNLSSCAEAGLPASCNNSDSGHPVLDFLSGGLDLNVAGFVGATPNNLFLKRTAGDPSETGLGLTAATPANEVGFGDSELFNFGKLALVGLDSGTITLSSLQSGEVGQVSFDATSVTAVQIGSSGVSAPIPISWSLADPFVRITADAGDVLAAADVEVSVPEPATAALLVLGILALAFTGALYRKRDARG